MNFQKCRVHQHSISIFGEVSSSLPALECQSIICFGQGHLSWRIPSSKVQWYLGVGRHMTWRDGCSYTQERLCDVFSGFLSTMQGHAPPRDQRKLLLKFHSTRAVLVIMITFYHLDGWPCSFSLLWRSTTLYYKDLLLLGSCCCFRLGSRTQSDFAEMPSYSTVFHTRRQNPCRDVPWGKSSELHKKEILPPPCPRRNRSRHFRTSPSTYHTL